MKHLMTRLAVCAVVLAVLFVGGRKAFAATFVVNSTTDAVDDNPGNGVCHTAAGECTLRAAVMEANALAGADIITLPAGEYDLTISGAQESGSAAGDLNVYDTLTINGSGANTTKIVQTVQDGVIDTMDALTLNDVMIANGNGLLGGGITDQSESDLNLNRVIMVGNEGGIGGAIYKTLHTLTIRQSAIYLNLSDAGTGGGIAMRYGPSILHVINSTIGGNYGSGVYLYSDDGASTQVTASIVNSTIAAQLESSSGAGDGFGLSGLGAKFTLKNSIIGYNQIYDCNISGNLASAGGNVIGDSSCGSLNGSNSVGSAANLGSLSISNGGTTPTFSLLSNSPAIDFVANGSCTDIDSTPINVDQRGNTRPYHGSRCDSGSFESTYDKTPPTVVLAYASINTPASAGVVTIEAVYSEDITDDPTISIDQPGTVDIQNAPMSESVDRSHWIYDYNVNTRDGSSYVDGTATVSLSTTHDAANNVSASPTNYTFVIDSVPISAMVTTDLAQGPVTSESFAAAVSGGINLVVKYNYRPSCTVWDDASNWPIYVSGTTLNFTDESHNNNTICIQAWDSLGARAYLSASHQINIDITPPSISVLNPDFRPSTSKTVDVVVNEGTLSTKVLSQVSDPCDGNSGYGNPHVVSQADFSSGLHVPTTFNSVDDNGKAMCYRAVDGLGNVSYKKSAAITGITPPNVDSKSYNFVRRMYTRALGREADSSGVNYWYNRLVAGQSTKLQIIDAYIRTDEYYRHYVSGIYHEFMNRDADQSGLDYWTNAMLQGLSKTDLISNFAYSPEYLSQGNSAFVASLYQDFMNRSADPSGVSYWVAQLNSGVKTKQGMIRDFFYSYEFNAKYVQEQYQQVLERGTDGSGEAFFVGQLQHGMDRMKLTSILLDSEEFWNH